MFAITGEGVMNTKGEKTRMNPVIFEFELDVLMWTNGFLYLEVDIEVEIKNLLK